MCVPTTPLLSCLTTAQQNRMRRVNTRCQKNSDEFWKKSKPGGLNQAGRPKNFGKSPKHPHWSRIDRAWTCAKGPPRMATGPGRPAPPVGHSLASFACSLFAISTPYSFLVSCNFIQNHTNWIQMKYLNEMTRKSLNLFTNIVLLSFISYASTELTLELLC